MLKHISFFAGIRGFELAADMAGWETVASVEINEDLNRRFKIGYPNTKQHEDIKKTDFTPYKGLVDVVSGGFPCQPFSNAGERKGTNDERHLWPEMLRGIRQIEAPWVVGENVRGLVNWSDGLVFEQVCADLENEGYEVQPFLLPVAGINAPHERYRIFFVAYSDAFQRKRQQQESIRGTGEKQPSFATVEAGRFVADASSGGWKDWRYKKFNWQEKEWQRIFREFERFSRKRHSSNATHIGCQQGGPAREWRDGFTHSGSVPSNPDSTGREKRNLTGFADRPGQPAGRLFDCWDEWTTEPPVCGLDDGVPFGLDVFRLRNDLTRLYPTATEKEIERAIQKTATAYRNEMIKGFGNAIVPQLVYRIFMAINQYMIDIKKKLKQRCLLIKN